MQINGQTFVWSIVSRRSIHKAGTRFFSRGINDDGQVANFVETEQIIEFNGEHISFVQVFFCFIKIYRKKSLLMLLILI